MTDRKKEEMSRRDDGSDDTALAIPGIGLPRIFEDFMEPFDGFMHPLLPRSLGTLLTEFGGEEPNIDLQDRGDHYVLTGELPGFDRNDVEVRVGGFALELKGNKKTHEESNSREGARTQSSSSYIQRYLTLPEEVVPEKVSGTLKNGVLELKLPKKEPKALNRSRKVDLK